VIADWLAARHGCATIGPVMPVDPELLAMLVCPLCKASLSLVEEGQGLECSECGRIYPVRDDIPVMLVSEAKTRE